METFGGRQIAGPLYMEELASSEEWRYYDVGGDVYRVHPHYITDGRGVPLGMRWEGSRAWWDQAAKQDWLTYTSRFLTLTPWRTPAYDLPPSPNGLF